MSWFKREPSELQPTEEDKRLIESVAKNTAGVIGINNNLGVALQPTGRTATVPGEIFNLHVEGLSAPDRTLAQRILERYTTEKYKDARQWRAWLDKHRSRLFFSDVGGYKFMIDPGT